MKNRTAERPVYYSERHRLRRSGFPDLHSATRPPTLARTTTTEVTDEDVGLALDPIAQQRAVEYIRAALAFRDRQMERAAVTRRTFIPTSTLIATALEDTEDDVGMPPGVVMVLTPTRARFDG